MALRYQIDRSRRLVELTGDARPTPRGFDAFMDTILADPLYESGFDFLADWSTLHEPPSRAYVESAIAYFTDHAPQLGECCWASVVGDKATYGMTRMAEMLAGRASIKIKAFDSRAEALIWLRRDVPGTGAGAA